MVYYNSESKYIFFKKKGNDTMENKQLLMNLINTYGIDEVFHAVDLLSNIVFFTDDNELPTFADKDNHDVYERIAIIYNAVDGIKKNNTFDDLSIIEFYGLSDYTLIEDVVITAICRFKNKSDQKIMQLYKTLLSD